MSITPRERWARSVNGLPIEPDPSTPLPRRILTSPWFWGTLAALVVYAACLVLMYLAIMDGVAPEDVAAIQEGMRFGARWALPTLLFWVVVFRWADRFRRQRWLVWLLTLGWGACVATYFSMEVNTWAAIQMKVTGGGNPATAAGPAVYVAPFVEEFAKATVLFLLAILARNRIVSRLGMISLAGLSAAGFAFTENILYYSQAMAYASKHMEVGNAETAVLQLVMLRGVWTAFGHPLFTMMTAIGLAISLRSKSKVVRVVAPLAGYLCGALLHMTFNSLATLFGMQQLIWIYWLGAVPIVLAAALFVVRQLFVERRLIAERLTDYVRMGWLRSKDPLLFSRLWIRMMALLMALTNGPRTLLSTLRLQRAFTELAYLRDAINRGIVDEAGIEREKDLLYRTRALRGQAIDDPSSEAWNWGWRRRQAPAFAPPSYPGPAGIGGNWPAPATAPTSAPLGSTGVQYSTVDPRWAPPG